LASAGIIASIIGNLFVNSGEDASQSVLLVALRKGVFISAFLTAVFGYFIIKSTLGHIGVYASILYGLVGGIIIGLGTEYYTSDKYKPAQEVANAAKTGPATVIISGISTGMMSTVLPVITIVIAILASFYSSGGAAKYDSRKTIVILGGLFTSL